MFGSETNMKGSYERKYVKEKSYKRTRDSNPNTSFYQDMIKIEFWIFFLSKSTRVGQTCKSGI